MWSDTWVAPFVKAACVTAATMAGICSAEAEHDEPNGPNSTSTPPAAARGVDRRPHVGAGLALDERLDGELEHLHDSRS